MSKQNSSGLMSRSSAVKFRTVAISGKGKTVSHLTINLTAGSLITVGMVTA